MRVLLDTNVFLWLHAAPERVGGLLPMLEDPSTERLVSAVVGWEIAIKHGLGRLQLPEPPERWVPSRIQRGAMVVVPIELSHVLGVADLPHHHRDPFDRLLVSVARMLDVPIVTSDPVFAGYGVEVLAPG